MPIQIASKFTKLEFIQSAIEYGAYASPLSGLNDPYEQEGIKYPGLYRVCCLTSAKWKMLMWAHYTSHYGCRIDFSFDQSTSNLLDEVAYVNEFISHRELSSSEVASSLKTKGAEWSYEKEIRAVWVEGEGTNAWAKNSDGDIFLRGKVKQITFGIRSGTAKEYLDTLKYLRNVNEGMDEEDRIEIAKCQLSADRYELQRDKQFNYLREIESIERQ